VDTLQGHQSIYPPDVKYGLEETSIRAKLLQVAQANVNRIELKLGYNRLTPTSIVYAPMYYGGISLQDLTIEEGLAHVIFLVVHVRAGSDISHSLITLLESSMVTTGTVTYPLENKTEYTYIHSLWIDSIPSF
jgi:hypothetical protein